MNKELIEMLKNGVVSVTFGHTDGSEEVRVCTLNESLIPATKMPKGSEKRSSEFITNMFSLDLNEWGSFRNDSIISFRNILNEVELSQ